MIIPWRRVKRRRNHPFNSTISTIILIAAIAAIIKTIIVKILP